SKVFIFLRKILLYCYLLSFYLIFLINSSANSDVDTSFAHYIKRAKSYVTTFEAIVFSIDSVILSAASCQPRWSSINEALKISDDGFTLFKPAYFGAVPCVASNIAWPVS